MLKTLIVLPNGTELVSGIGTVNAIQSVTITECVNGAQELTLGSTCSNMVEAKIITPGGGVSLSAGDEIAVYRVAEDGTRHAVGLFTAEKPARPSANSLSITAYDRVSWLDKDLTQWLHGLDQWPYPLIAFARAVCTACGLELVEQEGEELPNSTYLVQRFSADGITGRKLMQWVGEICGRFCRATADGRIEFAWYTPVTIGLGTTQINSIETSYRDGNLTIKDDDATVTDGDDSYTVDSAYMNISDDGNGNVVLQLSPKLLQQYYFQNGLSFEDYTVAPIQKVQLRQNEEDVGTVYPDGITDAVNTYIITGNYLLTASSGKDLVPVAQALYEHLSNIEPYTPCKVSIPANLLIRAGNTVKITDRNGRTITAYVMTRTQSGQRDTLECTGSARRDSSTVVNNQTFQAYMGKVLNLRADVDGLKVKNADNTGRVASLELDLGGVRASVEKQEDDISGVKRSITEVTTSAREIELAVKSIKDNGVEKVSNSFGLTIDESAVQIKRDGSNMTNRLDERGMKILRGEGENQTVMLKADADGVIATDVTVHNYLIVGSNARFEDYSSGTGKKRTACFWIGGES
jgi:hypothetical protein